MRHTAWGRTLALTVGGAVGAGVLAARAAPRRATDAELLGAARRLLEKLLPVTRRFSVQLWDGTVIPATQAEDARIAVPSAQALGRALHLPVDMALGEAYLHGDLDAQGDLSAIVSALDHYDAPVTPADLPGLIHDVLTLRREARSAPQGDAAAHLSGDVHSRERDRAAIAHHYDVSNAFYQLWLDPRMVYSCGYWPQGVQTLADAQTAKLDLICRKLRLGPGDRLLDIGSGWGGLAIYAAQTYGARVLGVTLSREQLAEARARAAAAGVEGLVRFELMDYRDVTETFDKVSSVGMAEHVGRRNMPLYFRSAWERLRPGGLMLNHAISDSANTVPLPRLIQSGQFASRYVFPDGELLPIWETLRAAEGVGFEVRDTENLREHYARTLRAWVANLNAHADEALALVGPERLRIWRLYMSASAYYFEHNHIGLVQSLLARPDEEGRVSLPPSRADLYR